MGTKELFELIQSKLILDLKENEVECPNCKGLRMMYEEKDGKGYITNCLRCYTGKLYKCNHCGKAYKSQCDCEGANQERRWTLEKKTQEKLNKAEKIKFSEYDGYLSSPVNEERIVDKEEFEEQYLDEFDAETSPKYIFAMKSSLHFGLDICDVINDKTEDGYEDMYSFLDMKSPLLQQAQELLDKWYKENEKQILIYNEDFTVCVDLSELYEAGIRQSVV